MDDAYSTGENFKITRKRVPLFTWPRARIHQGVTGRMNSIEFFRGVDLIHNNATQ